jgi:hypothetical protein
MSQDEARFSRRDWAPKALTHHCRRRRSPTKRIVYRALANAASGNFKARMRTALYSPAGAPQAVRFLLVLNLSEEAVDPERRVRENVGGAKRGSRFPDWRANRMKRD